MSLYNRSRYSVGAPLTAAHARCVASLGSTGTWWSGEQRAAFVAHVRAARKDTGVAEFDGGAAISDQAVSPQARAVARAVATRPETLDVDFYTSARNDGLGEEEYVETVAVAAFTCNLDIFARGIDLPPVPITVAGSDQPPRTRPQTAREEGAWVATVPAGRRGGDEAQSMYGEAMMPFIIRALSLVPADTRSHLDIEQAQYLPLKHFAEFDYQHHPGLSRSQVEVVSGRVSALNECFY